MVFIIFLTALKVIFSRSERGLYSTISKPMQFESNKIPLNDSTMSSSSNPSPSGAPVPGQ